MKILSTILSSHLGLIFLTFLGAAEIEAQTPQEVAEIAFSSTTLIVMEDQNGQPLSLGSGFFVGETEVASNLHVVEGAAGGYVKIIGHSGNYNIEGMVAVDRERDLVILKVSGSNSTTLQLGNSDSVQVGESVYAVGNPQGLEGTFSNGIVSSIREIGTNKLIQITAPISPGSSGGPVLNGEGEVIGVSVATYRGGQNLNFAIPSEYLVELLKNLGPVKPLSQVKSSKTQNSIFADLGESNTDGLECIQLTWSMPGNQFGGNYSFSIRNKLRYNVKNVYCLVVFNDSEGNPIEIDVVSFEDVIPARLAKRVNSAVDGSIGLLTNWKASAVEFRILDFEITN